MSPYSCDGLMHKNGEQNVINFACAESRGLFVHGKSLSFCLNWPICVRNRWPASVYTWMWCLWHISSFPITYSPDDNPEVIKEMHIAAAELKHGDDDNLIGKCFRNVKRNVWRWRRRRRQCKGTSVHSLTSPVSHYVYMYSPWSLYISDHTCTTPTS
jgi:hypothetical protein